MSAKEYIEAYPHMTENQKDIMQELWWGAVNHDCHAWVEENDVKAALYDLFINIRTEELPIINKLLIKLLFANLKLFFCVVLRRKELRD